jgi:hypothetical protein
MDQLVKARGNVLHGFHTRQTSCQNQRKLCQLPKPEKIRPLSKPEQIWRFAEPEKIHTVAKTRAAFGKARENQARCKNQRTRPVAKTRENLAFSAESVRRPA